MSKEQTENQIRILNIVGSELQQSSTGTYTTEIDGNREDALSYYMGNLPGGAPEGRSQVVSTDVADAIEWILPQIIKALVSKGPIITFDAIGENDEEQARMESEYVHDVFMGENEGFLNLYEFVKDALLQKNGVMKIYYDDTPETSQESYTGLMEEQVQMMISDPAVQPLSINPDGETQGPQGPIPTYAVELERTESAGQIQIECIAPEEFRIDEFHNSLSLKDARFVAHVTMKSRSDLITEGYDAETINMAAAGSDNIYQRSFRFTEQGESPVSALENYSEDTSQDLLEVSECYMQIDAEGDGVAQLHKVTVLGGETPDILLDFERVEEIPFVSSSCIIMPHKFIGLSLYDRLKMIQDQKTSLWRNILDNLYLQNNREKEVLIDQVNVDDLIVSRPGGIKRVKQMGSIRELEVQPIGPEGMMMMDYLDTVRTGRAGVSPDTAGTPEAVGNDTAHGVERIMSAKEELTGLMIRAVAETGVKAAYLLIRDLLVRHRSTTEQFKYRGSWMQVQPSTWGRRSRTTVAVGTGTGDDARKQAALTQVLGYQEKLLMAESPLVDHDKTFNALDEFSSSAGLDGGEKYFVDPKSEQGQQAIQQQQETKQQESQKMDEMQAKITEAQQQLAQAEMIKGEAAMMAQQIKAQMEQVKLQQSEAKLQADTIISGLEQELKAQGVQLDEAKAASSLEFDYAKLETDDSTKRLQINATHSLGMNKLEFEAGKQMDDGIQKKADRDASQLAKAADIAHDTQMKELEAEAKEEDADKTEKTS